MKCYYPRAGLSGQEQKVSETIQIYESMRSNQIVKAIILEEENLYSFEGIE